MSPGRRQAIIWTNARILLIGPLGTNFSQILIEIYTFSFKKMHLKMSSGKWRPFCLGLNVLRQDIISVNLAASQESPFEKSICSRARAIKSLWYIPCFMRQGNGQYQNECGGHAYHINTLGTEWLKWQEVGRPNLKMHFKQIFVGKKYSNFTEDNFSVHRIPFPYIEICFFCS